MSKSNPAKAWLRHGVGGLVALFSLAGLIWISVLFYAEFRYRGFPARSSEESNLDLLTQYAGKLERLLRLDPSNGEIRNLYASVLGKMGDLGRRENYPKAVANLTIARQTHNAQNSLFFLADMYEKMGDIPKAEASMAQCLKINPADRQFNPAWLRLLNKRLMEMKERKKKKLSVSPQTEAEARRAYGEATLNWAVRAPHDLNSYLFLGNFYVEPLYALQAYRCYLIGLSQSRWMNLNKMPMIQPQLVLVTIRQIIGGKYAKPYRGLP